MLLKLTLMYPRCTLHRINCKERPFFFHQKMNSNDATDRDEDKQTENFIMFTIKFRIPFYSLWTSFDRILLGTFANE